MANNNSVVELGDAFWKTRYDELKALIVELEVTFDISVATMAQAVAEISRIKEDARRKAAAQIALQLMKPSASRQSEIRMENGDLRIITSLLVVPASVRDKFERMP